MKIGFYSQNFTVLKNYWLHLKDEFDCWWGVPEKKLYDKLKSLGEKKISFHEEPHFKNNSILNKNQFVSKDNITFQKKIAFEIDPDVWIVDTPNLLNHIKRKVPKIQVFHALPMKKHVFYKPNLDHDLLLLPGNYHKDKFVQKFNLKNYEDKLKVVGWPRVDDLINNNFNREDILKKLGLDITKKTVMYAPTWGWGQGNDYLFCRWFKDEIKIFEELCKSVMQMNLNLIVRLHSLSFKADDKNLIRIAKKYNVCWPVKETSNFLDDPNEYLSVTDILISDVSGIISEFAVLNRPIIFIDPDNSLDAWNDSDMPKSFRAGEVVKQPEELITAIKKAVQNPGQFSEVRKKFLSKIYSNLEGNSSKIAIETIKKFLQLKKNI